MHTAGGVAVAAPVVVPGTVPEVVPAGNSADPESGSSAGAQSMVVDTRDNELDKVVSQPLLVRGSGVAEERVLDPSPSQVLVSVLEDSAGRSGVPQEEVLESSPSFSPLSGTCLSDTPSSGVSEDVVGSGDDGPASLVDSRPLRSRIPVKVARSGVLGDLLPPLVSREDAVRMVQKLKAALPSSTDELVASGRVGGSSQPSRPFAVPLPHRVGTRSGSGMALRTSSRSRSRSGDERPPLSPDPHRSSRRRPSSPSPARRHLPLSHHPVSFLFIIFFFVMGFSLNIFCFIMALTVISVNVNGLRDGDKRLGFLQ